MDGEMEGERRERWRPDRERGGRDGGRDGGLTGREEEAASPSIFSSTYGEK